MMTYSTDNALIECKKKTNSIGNVYHIKSVIIFVVFSIAKNLFRSSQNQGHFNSSAKVG